MNTLLDRLVLDQSARSAGWVIYDTDPVSGAQRPVCRYLPIPAAALASRRLSPTQKVALAILVREDDRQRRWRRVDADGWWRGPSCVELAGAYLTERTLRRARRALAAEGLIAIAESKGSRVPDRYRVHRDHPLVAGDIVSIPTALAEQAGAAVALLVGLVAYVHGDRGPGGVHDLSLTELAHRLGMSRTSVVHVRGQAIDAGYLSVLSSRGYATGLAVLESGWWSRPSALIEGRTPARVADRPAGPRRVDGPDLPVTWPGSAGHLVRICRSL